MTMLNVVIGIIFILLLLSLLATTIMEIISSLLHMRGKILEKSLRNMLGADNDRIFQAFKENTLYEQLSGKYLGKNTPPSYMDAETFKSIFMNIMGGFDNLEHNIQHIPSEKLKNILCQFLDDAKYNMEDFTKRLEKWYDDVMGRATGWYKRNLKQVLIFVGIGIAVIFNADTIEIYNKLSKDPETALEIANMAQQYTEQNQTVVMDAAAKKEFEELTKDVNMLVSGEIKKLRNPLGLGWSNVDLEMGYWAWMQKILGWLVTALAISLGAPFWFDMLSMLVNVRNAGKKPEKTLTGATELQPRQPAPEASENMKKAVRSRNQSRSVVNVKGEG
jgi:hypothetical protein